MRAVSSGTGETGCGRRSDMDDLRTRKPSNAMAHHKAADFANGIRSFVIQAEMIDLDAAVGQHLLEVTITAHRITSAVNCRPLNALPCVMPPAPPSVLSRWHVYPIRTHLTNLQQSPRS